MSTVRDDIQRAMSKPVWKARNPKSKSSPLSPGRKQAAMERATKAGRPYPNLIDNMWAARRQS